MNLFELDGRIPQVHEEAFVAPTAVLIGDVHIAAGASVWFGAVLRADYEPIRVEEGANVQDNSVLHAPPGHPIVVGPRATIGHLCVVHGARLDEECLVGNGATVLDGVSVGARSLIAAHALVREGTEVPPEVIMAGVPAKQIARVEDPRIRELIDSNHVEYARLATRYLGGLTATGPLSREGR